MSSKTIDTQACERLDPETANEELYAEHVARYQFALAFAARKRVLDCATGVGYGAALLAEVADWVVGVDNAPEAIREAAQRYARPNVRYLVADGQSLPFDSKSLDLVISLETIEHTLTPELFLAEFRRVLTPSGMLIVSTPNTDVYRHEDGVENPFHPHEFTIEELSELLRSYFPSVTLLAERHQSSVLIGPPDTVPMITWFGDQRSPRVDVLAHSPYVVAVCGSQPIHPNGLVRFASGGSRMQELVAWARAGDEDVGRARQRLRDLEEQLIQRTKWANDLDAELSQARAVIADLESLVVERTRWAQQLDAELLPARDAVAQLQGLVEERTTWAQQLDAELLPARNAVAQLQDQVVGRTTWAQQLEAELQRARDAVAQLQDQVVGRTRWAQQLNSELQRARGAVAQLQDQVAGRTTWAQQLDIELQRARNRVDELENELDSRTRWARQLEAELSAARQQLARAPAKQNGQ